MPRATRKKPVPVIAAPPHTICAMLGVRDDDLRPAINSGELPAYRVGARRRIVLADAVEWLRNHPQVARGPHG